MSFRCRKPVGKADQKPRYGTITLDADEFIRRFLLQETAKSTNPSHLSDKPGLSTPLARQHLPPAQKAREQTDPDEVAPRGEHPAACEATDQVEPIVLSERDSVRVRELLEDPPEPTPALMAAAARRKARA